MFLSEWREFPSAPCLAGKKKNLDESTRLDVVEIVHVPDMLPSLFPSWSGLRTYQQPGMYGKFISDAIRVLYSRPSQPPRTPIHTPLTYGRFACIYTSRPTAHLDVLCPCCCSTLIWNKTEMLLSNLSNINFCKSRFNNNNNNNNKLQFGCHPVAVVILHVYKIWNWLLLNLSLEGYMRSI